MDSIWSELALQIDLVREPLGAGTAAWIMAAVPAAWIGLIFGTVLHEFGHGVMAMAVGVRPTVIGIFSGIRDRGRTVCLPLDASAKVRIEIGLAPCKGYVAFDDQHPVWRSSPESPGSLQNAPGWKVAVIALAGPLGQALPAALLAALLIGCPIEAAWLRASLMSSCAILAASAVGNLVPVAASDGEHVLRRLRGLPLEHFRPVGRFETLLPIAVWIGVASLVLRCLAGGA